MNQKIIFIRTALLLTCTFPAAFSQTIKYEFTGGVMVPTVSELPAGVTASNFALGGFTFANLSDNGGDGNSLRISAGDVGTSSGSAKKLSFSLTIPADVTVNLTSFSLDYTSGGLTGTEFINARIFSSIDGYDDLTNDTIAFMGRIANGADSATPQSISLVTPESNNGRGTNVTNGEFDNLTNKTVTFYLPFVQSGGLTSTDYVDIDNITLTFGTAQAGISSFTATAITSFETALAWNENLSDETGFVIERSVTGSGVWETITTTEAGVTSFRDLTMPPNASYTYRISALLPEGETSPTVLSASVTVPAVPGTLPLIVMPMGDSITEGAGGVGGYRSPLYTSLINAGLPIHFVGTSTVGTSTTLINANEIHHEGHGSYATDLLTGNVDGLLAPVAQPYGTPPNTNNGGYWLTGTGSRPAVFPDVILLMIGTNDLGMFRRTPAQTYAYYNLLLTKLVTLRPNAQIICSTLVPFTKPELYAPGKDYSHREADNVEFNQMLPGLVASYQTNGHRVRFSDVRQNITPEMIGADGVHPSVAGYDAIAAAWFDAMKQLPFIESWRLLHFGSASASGSADDLADPDSDGDVNLMEYALGTNPMGAGTRQAAGTTVTEAGSRYLAVTFPRRKHANLSYVVEVSSDLTSWSANTQQAGSPASVNADFEQVTFRDRQPIIGNEKRFIRVKVVKP